MLAALALSPPLVAGASLEALASGTSQLAFLVGADTGMLFLHRCVSFLRSLAFFNHSATSRRGSAYIIAEVGDY